MVGITVRIEADVRRVPRTSYVLTSHKEDGEGDLSPLDAESCSIVKDVRAKLPKETLGELVATREFHANVAADFRGLAHAQAFTARKDKLTGHGSSFFDSKTNDMPASKEQLTPEVFL